MGDPLAEVRFRTLGHAVIDDDHLAVVDRVNALIAVVAEARADESMRSDREGAIRRALDALVLAMQEHDHEEEAIMQMAGYPLFESHRRQHQELRADLTRYAPYLFSPQSEMALQALEFFRNTSGYHVRMWDAPFVTWLSEQKHGRPHRRH